LFYEDLGDPAGPPVLLIMGVGAQLPMWPDGFCELLIERGFRVIRYDHRDIGLSTKMAGQKADGSVYARVVRYALGRSSPVPYTLVDMAEDARSLLDHLRIDRAHVVGASMGGMIAQVLGGSHPDRVASLALLMTRPRAATTRKVVSGSSTRFWAPAACCGSPGASPRRRWSSTAPRIRWCEPATVATSPASSTVHASSSWTAWATTFLSRCGGRWSAC
jgi:pimeloyl-ACP methyl ester carboxylesterase